MKCSPSLLIAFCFAVGLGFAAMSGSAQADTYVGIASTNNGLQGEFQTGGDPVYFNDGGTGSNSNRVGIGGGSGNRRVNNPVWGFTLPELTGDPTIENVNFEFTIAGTSGTPTVGIVVSLLDQEAPGGSGVGNSDFTGSLFSTTSPGVNEVLNGGIVIGTAAAVAEGTLSFDLSGAALSAFQNLYTGSTPSQTDVYFRISLDGPLQDVVDANGVERYNFGGAYPNFGERSLTINPALAIPEPSSLAVLGLAGGWVVLRRRRKIA